MAVIQYIERDEIDTAKWNQVIESASNNAIYAYSWYLDTICEQWAALVLNDYDAVMPLPWRRKYGFHYLYTPAFCNPLGLFAKPKLIISLNQFLDAIPGKFKLWDLNISVDEEQRAGKYRLVKRQNYLLDLNSDYQSLFKDFRTSYKQMLNKENKELVVRFDISPREVIDLAKLHPGNKAIKESAYQQLHELCEKLYSKSMLETVGVYSKEERLLASAVFFKTGRRIYYVIAGNANEGRDVGASHHVLNAIIQKFAAQPLKLDFEGSDIPGIAFFFEGFGATKEHYYYIHNNKLPWWCKWLKKPQAI